jgi:cephalosporin hydroxylase
MKNFNNASKHENCSAFEVDNWILSEFIINKLIKICGIHPYPLSELMLMTASVARIKPTHIFEWGTNIGKSARIFYEVSNYFNINTEIHSIDLPDHVEHIEHPKNKRGYLVKGKKNVFLHQADGLAKMDEIYQTLKSPRVLVFIDGDHRYDSVKRELDFIIDTIPEASILLHDTFYQSEGSGYNTGPFKAIENSLHKINNNYQRVSVATGLPGMTLLFKNSGPRHA